MWFFKLFSQSLSISKYTSMCASARSPTLSITCRAALELELQKAETACAEQLLSARQAAVSEAVQHSSDFHARLDRAASQHKQLQQQVQVLQKDLATKEAELASTQLQLASSIESSKKLQDKHAQVC